MEINFLPSLQKAWRETQMFQLDIDPLKPPHLSLFLPLPCDLLCATDESFRQALFGNVPNQELLLYTHYISQKKK